MSNIRLKTPQGTIDIALDLDRAPKTARHFLRLIREGHLRGAHFYRTVTSAQDSGKLPSIDVIQGGIGWDRCEDMPGVEHETTTETGLRHIDGTVSMARNFGKNATSEFFICIGAQPKLDAGVVEGPGATGFAAFGQVVAGMKVVKDIQALPTTPDSPTGEDRFRHQFLTDPVSIAFELLPA